MWFIGAIVSGLKVLTGPITNFFDYRTQRAIVEGKVREKSIMADVEFAHIKKEMHAINQGWWVTRWIVPGFAYPVMLWWILVFVDTIFQIPTWSVAAPPEPVYSWTGEIILSFFIVRGAEVLGNSIGRVGIVTGIMDGVRGIFRKEK